MSSRGFTLVEVLASVVLLGVVLLGVAPMFVYGIRKNAAASDMGRAGALAVERMELLRGEPYTALDPGGSVTANQSVGSVPFFDVTDPDFVVRWEIANNATPVGGKLITVRAEARRQVSGDRKAATITTLRGG